MTQLGRSKTNLADSGNGRIRAPCALHTVANGALGDRDGGTPGTDRIDNEFVTAGVGQVQVFLELTVQFVFKAATSFFRFKRGDSRLIC